MAEGSLAAVSIPDCFGAGYLKYFVPVSTDTTEIARDWAPVLRGEKLFCASKQGFKLIALLFLAMLD